MKEFEQNSFDYMSSPLSNLPQHPGGMQLGEWNQQRLSPEQIDKLMKQLSTQDKAEIRQKLAECNSKKMYTRSLPAAAVFCATLHVVRQKFYMFGPKSNASFVLLFGGGSFLVANIYSMLSCSRLIAPILPGLYVKYNSGESRDSGGSYDALRSANRSGADGGDIYSSLRPASRDDGSLSATHWEGFEASSRPFSAQNKSLDTKKFDYEDVPFVMSGTPLGNGAKKKYGDDFSKNKFE